MQVQDTTSSTCEIFESVSKATGEKNTQSKAIDITDGCSAKNRSGSYKQQHTAANRLAGRISVLGSYLNGGFNRPASFFVF
jgi:hypothetical protein